MEAELIPVVRAEMMIEITFCCAASEPPAFSRA
jgi:hypothetical protein